MKDAKTTENMNAESQTINSPQYWQSIQEWQQDAEFKELAEREFKTSPFAPEGSQSGWARREFLKLSGASMALASFGCIRRPAQKIVPYVNRPEEVVPGIANYYSSSYSEGSQAYGMVVKTREGRPIKLEGNPDHPVNKGSLPARAYASILALYDPDRLSGPKQNLLNKEKTNRDVVSANYEEIDEAVTPFVKERELAIVTGALTSPSSRELISEFCRVTGSKHYVLDNQASSVAAGQKESYGQAGTPRYDISKADYILAVNSDFLGTHAASVEYAREFAQRRDPNGNMNKLVAVESMLTMTGMNADERHRIKASETFTFLLAVAKELADMGSISLDGNVKQALSNNSAAIEALGLEKDVVKSVAKGLAASKGKGLVAAHGMQTEQPLAIEIQVLANYLNSALNNDGRTVDYARTPLAIPEGASDLADFVKDVQSGRVKAAVINGVNPVYSYPAGSGIKEALKALKVVVYTGDKIDETGGMCRFVAPDHHALEAWGDSESQEGIYSIQQPTIRPMGNTRSFQEGLLSWASKAGRAQGVLSADNWYDYVRSFWDRKIRPASASIKASSFDDFWYQVLQIGVVETSAARSRDSVSGGRSAKTSLLSEAKVVSSEGMELILYSQVAMGDGALANVPWLQELPDPVSKIVWDNYLSVSPNFAHKQGFKEGQIVKVENSAGVSLEVPCHIQPGMHDEVGALAVGYGRKGAGKVADGVGVNSYELAVAKDGRLVYSALPIRVAATDKSTQLVSPQGHHSMEGRQIIVEATLDQYKKDPAANIHKHKVFSMWNKHEYKGHRWGMAVDLNTCNGCSACVIACQSENNIPTVGKRYVMEGRIMSWIRIDRYYTGEPENPGVLAMPVMCQHCENAPCETVCPVAATVHGDEGTNDMIYNRCVGTRYCANNCPYKVRRFNWFDNVKNVREPQNMAMNPEVTVRDRGVMEKCTFCTHKIKEAKQKAKREDRTLQDGDVKTACQLACAAGAITFGDVNDPNSKVSQAFKKQNNYSLLEELNAVPMVRYATKIRNTDKLKADAHHGSKGGH